MPGVPEIEVPTAQSEPMRTVAAPPPVLADYAGVGVGSALNKLGEGLHEVGMASYHRAMEAKAQEGETAFQKRALALRDEYRNKYNWDAIGSHTQYSEALEKARKEVGDALPSKYAQTVYANNSLRNMRFVQESMDAHFEQQNRSYQLLQLKNGTAEDVKLGARMATEKPYNAKSLEDLVEARKQKNMEFAVAHGMDPESAETFANNEAGKVVDAALKVMLDKKSGQDPETVKKELDKYAEKNMVSEGRYRDAMHGIGGSQVNAWVSKEMSNMIRTDASGKTPDPEGAITHKQVLASIDKIDKDDPLRQQKVDAIEKEWSRHLLDYQKAGHEMEERMRLLGKRDGGPFAVPRNDPDWHHFTRLYPGLADELEAKASSRQWTAGRRGRTTIKEASQDAWGATRYYLDNLTQDQLRDTSPATVAHLMNQNYSGPGDAPEPAELAKATEFLKKAQEGKLDPVQRKFTQIANQVLEQEYGNKAKTVKNINRAQYVLDDLYAESKAKGKPLSEIDLREQLAAKFHKEGWFKDREGETYKPRHPAKISNDAERDALPPGTQYVAPDGTTRVKQ